MDEGSTLLTALPNGKMLIAKSGCSYCSSKAWLFDPSLGDLDEGRIARTGDPIPVTSPDGSQTSGDGTLVTTPNGSEVLVMGVPKRRDVGSLEFEATKPQLYGVDSKQWRSAPNCPDGNGCQLLAKLKSGKVLAKAVPPQVGMNRDPYHNTGTFYLFDPMSGPSGRWETTTPANDPLSVFDAIVLRDQAGCLHCGRVLAAGSMKSELYTPSPT